MPIHAPPYSTDSDLNGFNAQELERVVEVFHRVAEDFAPFDVDVTTEDPGDSIFAEGGSAIRVLISTDVDEPAVGGSGNQWFDDAGGVAYVGSWDWSSDTPVWVFENNLSNAKQLAEAASHEVGHSLNLNHDGTIDNEYYFGHGNGTTGWAPIMGIAYNQEVTQWSRGQYLNANNTEDDLQQISQRLDYRLDDHADIISAELATGFVPSGQTEVHIQGIIEQFTDKDVFRIDAYAQTQVQLDFEPVAVGANLDLEVKLIDEIGVTLSTINPQSELGAHLDITLNPGTYIVVVDGVGEGNPITGYSDYGSLGQYTITGIVDSADPVAGGPVAVGVPFVDNPLVPTTLTIPFNQPIDQSSFDLDDLAFLDDPDGNPITVNRFDFPSATEIRLHVDQLFVQGQYTGEIGPSILDLDGLEMDQDENGTPGESTDSFTFALNLTPDSNPFVGPRAISNPIPNRTYDATSIIVQFDQLLDTDSFFPFVDVATFSGADGSDLKSAINGFSFPRPDQLQIDFDVQATPGAYLIILGPEILDLEGFSMDQNGNGISGELTDSFTGVFILESAPENPGDFNNDLVVDAHDIDLMCNAIQENSGDSLYDLSGDGLVDFSDIDTLVLDIIGTLHGDANMDFVVDTSDFNRWNENKFQFGTGWATGNFNCDTGTDVSDFNVWSENKFRSALPSPVVQHNSARPFAAGRVSIATGEHPTPVRSNFMAFPRPARRDQLDSARSDKAISKFVVDRIWSMFQ